MEFVKKLLPLLIVAIVFAAGGYFIGKGAMSSGSASIYNAENKLAATKTSDTFGPAGVRQWKLGSCSGGKQDIFYSDDNWAHWNRAGTADCATISIDPNKVPNVQSSGTVNVPTKAQ